MRLAPVTGISFPPNFSSTTCEYKATGVKKVAENKTPTHNSSTSSQVSHGKRQHFLSFRPLSILSSLSTKESCSNGNYHTSFKKSRAIMGKLRNQRVILVQETSYSFWRIKTHHTSLHIFKMLSLL